MGPALSLRWSEGAAGRDQLWGTAARPLLPLSSRSDLEPKASLGLLVDSPLLVPARTIALTGARRLRTWISSLLSLIDTGLSGEHFHPRTGLKSVLDNS